MEKSPYLISSFIFSKFPLRFFSSFWVSAKLKAIFRSLYFILLTSKYPGCLYSTSISDELYDKISG